MSAKLSLNKFQLMWLFEGAAGKSHLRWDIYKMFIDDIYPQLDNNEREFLYTYIKRDTSWLWENKSLGDETPYQYWLQVLARYNPANQFTITAEYEDEKEIRDAYMWDGKYYIGFNRYFANEFIVKKEQKSFTKCTNKHCKSAPNCLRFLKYKDGDTLINESHERWWCEKCDYIIEDKKTC